MKIWIKENQKTKLKLIVPNFVIFNNLSLWILSRVNENSNNNIDKKQLKLFFKLLKRYAKQYKNLPIVQVETAGGDYVEIIL